MNNYYVIADVNGNSYLTKVEAYSLGGAEHRILDLSIYSNTTHEYSVQSVQAFDIDGMSTDFFRCRAMEARPVSFVELIATN